MGSSFHRCLLQLEQGSQELSQWRLTGRRSLASRTWGNKKSCKARVVKFRDKHFRNVSRYQSLSAMFGFIFYAYAMFLEVNHVCSMGFQTHRLLEMGNSPQDICWICQAVQKSHLYTIISLRMAPDLLLHKCLKN